MASADKILPHLIGGGDGHINLVSDGCMVIGFDDGKFQLLSLSTDTNSEAIIQDSVVSAEGWDNFISLVTVEMGKMLVIDQNDASALSIKHLDENSDLDQCQTELVSRAKQCIRDFNDITGILYRQGIYSDVTKHEARRADGFDSFSHLSAKFMKEVK